MSGIPPLAGDVAAGSDPDGVARFLYSAYRSHRNLVEDSRLPHWDFLCEQKRDRFRAIAAAVRQFPHYVTTGHVPG